MNSVVQPGSRDDRRGQLVEGEFTLTTEDFRNIAATLHAEAGIALHESKATLVYSRLAKRLRALGLESFRDYCALIADRDAGVDERQKMIAALTTNVTRFYREPHHFEHLRDKVIRPLIDTAKRGGPIRIWSAGCSNGQEPYTIALTILSVLPNAFDLDVKILATDIDPNMIRDGREGRYPAQAVEPVPVDQRNKWFEKNGDDFQVRDELKRMVSFKELNLMGPWPMKKAYDAIFCRNVVIYFEEETQAKVFSRFTPLMTPQARLYIGHSERLTGPAADHMVTDGVTTYAMKGAK
jgi:chemotaxis protein methyltransferase CheR